ncbi:MAG TPA: 16S rRNA (cytosine(967)-C(5))-methyltransferase RsmB [Gallionellaceae bacterium]|nr:16S rRNA (cytosine(967)-C(5))-methyltransferase RsmB [Gallionellaceae bacterium]
MDAAQQGASQVVCKVLGGRNLNQVLSATLQAASGLSSQQRAALQDLSYGTLRFYGQLACVLQQLLHKPVQDEQLRCLLLVALYQLQYSKAAPHTVVDHAVRAARTFNAGAGGLTNAVLRQFLRKRDALLAIAADCEEGRYSYPQWWVDELKEQYGTDAEAILLAGNRHPPMTLRVNLRRVTALGYLKLLAAQDIRASQVGAEALLLERPVPVERLPGFDDGLVSVQDAGAQYAAHLLDAHDGMHVLDACAAPGGKCAHLLELVQVDLLALDKDEQRLQRVRGNMQRLQLSARLQTGDAAQPGDWWDGKPFHRILADVPCSASGVVRRHPDIKWLRRREDIVGFVQQQGQILAALWQTLASDGKLLYSTCSVFAQENRRVIEEFMRQHSDARQLPLSVSGINEGQLLPNDQHDGFYYALLQKQA